MIILHRFQLSCFDYLDFEVKDPLPNVTQPLPRSFAGSISVNRAKHPNDTLFFWGFEKEQGSLTADAGERDEEPWLIWLNGGSVFLFEIEISMIELKMLLQSWIIQLSWIYD